MMEPVDVRQPGSGRLCLAAEPLAAMAVELEGARGDADHCTGGMRGELLQLALPSASCSSRSRVK